MTEIRKLPASYYASKEQFEKERQGLFTDCWHNVGRIEELPEHGDYLVRNFAVPIAAVVVTRGETGNLSAFHNVCSHRGSPVCKKRSGNTTAFVCPFHAWSYNLDGSVRNIPERQHYAELDDTNLALTSVKVDVWEGFIFVNLATNPQQTLIEHLGSLPERLKGVPFTQMAEQNYRYAIELKANWKLVRDAFVEGHHVRTVHPKTIADQFVSADNPFSHTMVLEPNGKHAYMSLDSNPEFLPTPTELVGVERGFQPITWDKEWPPGVNATRNDRWVMDVNVVFPNFFVDLFQHGLLTYRFIPLAVDRTLWEIDVYFPKAKTASERFYQETTLTRNRDALVEDIAIVEQIQLAYESGAKTEIHLHDEERLIGHLFLTETQLLEEAGV